jgi:hypothetical protein
LLRVQLADAQSLQARVEAASEKPPAQKAASEKTTKKPRPKAKARPADDGQGKLL